MFKLFLKQSSGRRDHSSRPSQPTLTHPKRGFTTSGLLVLGNQAVQRILQDQEQNADASSLAQRPLGFWHDFSRIPVRPRPNSARENLAISEPGDRYEQEADRIAEQVMSLKQPSQVASHNAESVHDSVDNNSSGGNALTSETRQFFEPRLGHSFANVRVHSDNSANESARSLGARAYTSGKHIFLAAGEYQPSTREGRQLLAHELAHVVQQSHVHQHTRPHTLAASLSRIASPKIQRRLIATGDASGFAALANSIITVQLQVVASPAGEISLRSTDAQGPPTREAQALTDALRRIISDRNTTTIAFIHGTSSPDPIDQQVMIGSYAAARIDLDDLGQLGSGEGISAGSALAHELVEQYRRQVFAEDYPTAHAAGMAEEEAVTGARRGASTRREIDATSYEIEVAYHYPDRTVFVTRVVRNQNIVAVRRRTTRP